MLCKIADLITEVPETGGLAPRVRDYLWTGDPTVKPDIVIRESDYRPHMWQGFPRDLYCYMESGCRFYANLLCFQGMMLHASAVVYDGRAYLFSGDSGVGKSTHTKLWQTILGEDRALIINDDKPALRYLDRQWFAYGTPWCGKDGININMKVPVAGICFLKRGEENSIRRLTKQEASFSVVAQTVRRFRNEELLDRMLALVEQLTGDIPIYELTNRPELEAARLSFETMRRGAKEANL